MTSFMLTIDQVITYYYPDLNNRKMSRRIIKSILRRLIHEKTFLDFAEEYPHLHGIEFIEQVLDYLHFSSAANNFTALSRLKKVAETFSGSLFQSGKVCRFLDE